MDARAEDRRATIRRLFKTQVVCRFLDPSPNEEFQGKLLNISLQGAQILIRAPFLTHWRIAVQLISPKARLIAELEATVRWIRLEGPDVARLGIRFDRELTADEFALV